MASDARGQGTFKSAERTVEKAAVAPSPLAGEGGGEGPFRRARHANATGTGLGLSLVRKIARHHGGDARIEQNGPGALTVLVML